MIELTTEELKQRFSDSIFKRISETADELGLECYVVGGYVRDIFLQRPSKDIDVVVVGSGIAMAEALARRLGRGAHLSVFKNFGTAQLKYHGTEVEFVGARKESYTHDSRKPIVEDARWKTTRTAGILLSMLGGLPEQSALRRTGRPLRRNGGYEGEDHPHAARPGHHLQRRPSAHDALYPFCHPTEFLYRR